MLARLTKLNFLVTSTQGGNIVTRGVKDGQVCTKCGNEPLDQALAESAGWQILFAKSSLLRHLS